MGNVSKLQKTKENKTQTEARGQKKKYVGVSLIQHVQDFYVENIQHIFHHVYERN